MRAREAALKSLLNRDYVADALRALDLDSKEKALAREIASGTVRQKLAIDTMIGKRVRLKPRDHAILRMSVYQLAFMDIPPYAVISEALKLSNHPFIHAILSNLHQELPQGLSAKAIAKRLSYPLWFVKRLISCYGQHRAEHLLKIQNQHVPLTARKIGAIPFKWADEGYIQNPTTGLLLQEACQNIQPNKILDLCASPGGKLLAAHDLFPQAELHANDLTERKLERLRENLTTYKVQATLTAGPGEDYTTETPFDLVIIDAPCSNSGVLYKRCEARWRLEKKNVRQLMAIQRALLTNGTKLGKAFLYMTCSILPEENDQQVEWAEKNLPVRSSWQKTQLPTTDGLEGGFAALLLL